MYDAVECYWVEPNGRAERFLRRYRRGDERDCPTSPGGYHNSTAAIGEFDVIWNHSDGAQFVAAIDSADYAGDERWPTHCGCGYQFVEDDHWQAYQEPISVAADGRRAFTAPVHGRSPSPGAMFDTYWRPELRKPDGLAVSVICPDGTVWCIDDEATSGGFWTREGTVPVLTVSPSIQTPDYHGHLQNGVLTAG